MNKIEIEVIRTGLKDLESRTDDRVEHWAHQKYDVNCSTCFSKKGELVPNMINKMLGNIIKFV